MARAMRPADSGRRVVRRAITLSVTGHSSGGALRPSSRLTGLTGLTGLMGLMGREGASRRAGPPLWCPACRTSDKEQPWAIPR
ncbi:hypothetical protein GCM10009837_09510 [Streptomyces durmitorensis]